MERAVDSMACRIEKEAITLKLYMGSVVWVIGAAKVLSVVMYCRVIKLDLK